MTAPPRILRVSHSTAMWGMETTMLSWAPLLAAEGIEVSYGSPTIGPFADELSVRHYHHEPIDFPAHRGLRTPESRILPAPMNLAREIGVVGISATRVAKTLRRYDLAHSHSLACHFEVALAGQMARRPVLLHIHDLVRPGVGRKLLDRAVAMSTRTYAISAAVRNCISTSLHHKVVVQHHGLDLKHYRPDTASVALREELGATEGQLLVGMLGRIDRPKGPDLLLDAVTGIEGVRVAIIGSAFNSPAGYVDDLTLRIRRDALNVGIYAPRTDANRVMQSLDVLVNASEAEPFGRTLIEAMASGIPVVGMRSGGIPEFVKDGYQGLLVDERTPEALRSAIVRLRDNRDLRITLGRHGREHVVQNHDLSRQVAEIASTYRDLIRK